MDKELQPLLERIVGALEKQTEATEQMTRTLLAMLGRGSAEVGADVIDITAARASDRSSGHPGTRRTGVVDVAAEPPAIGFGGGAGPMIHDPSAPGGIRPATEAELRQMGHVGTPAPSGPFG